MSQSIFNDKQICATYDATKIMDSVQAEKDGACPNGYTACNSNTETETKWHDVYCVPETDYPQKCPILSVDIV